MDAKQTFQESFKILNNFETSMFHRTFGRSFVLVGCYWIISSGAIFLNFIFKVSLLIEIVPFLDTVVFFIIFLFLSLDINSLKRTVVNNGSLSKLNSILGWLLVILGCFFKILTEIIFSAGFLNAFIINYFYIFLLYTLYFKIGKNLFSDKITISFPKFNVYILIIFLSHLFFWVGFSIFFPNIFSLNPYPHVASYYSFYHYFIFFNSLVNGSILILVGYFILKKSNTQEILNIGQ